MPWLTLPAAPDEGTSTLLGGAAVVLPITVHAQEPVKMLRVGVVSGQPRNSSFYQPFKQRMRELGYHDGKNFVFDYITVQNIDEYDSAYRELVSRHADIIFAPGPEIALKSALANSTTIPIVMVAIDYDPLARGYVTSLAKPTGNVTGLFLQQIELTEKRLQLLKSAGGLMSYGASVSSMLRLAARYVDRIARGVKPADFPIEQPSKFELVINLKTAKALGVTFPPSFLATADEVVE
jgi:ABC-type uncharacterized transport system substrate-binding protein